MGAAVKVKRSSGVPLPLRERLGEGWNPRHGFTLLELPAVRKCGSEAYTLIELLCVMGLMVFLLTIALGSALGWGRGAGLRSSVLGVQSSLALARQLAVTHSTRSFFVCGNSTVPVEAGYYVITTNDESGVIGETNYLPKGYVFVYTTNSVPFQSDGACAAVGDLDVVVREVRNQRFLAATVTVSRLTGIARTRE